MKNHPQPKIGSITYPEFESEFEVQADLYQKLKAKGWNVRGNVLARCRDQGKAPRCYLDLVVFDDQDQPRVIIECKNFRPPVLNRSLSARQSRRYSSFGLPVIGCFNLDDVPYALLLVEINLNQPWYLTAVPPLAIPS